MNHPSTTNENHLSILIHFSGKFNVQIQAVHLSSNTLSMAFN